MLTIKILGPGCANCRKLEAVTREALAATSLQADIVKVTDMKDILSYDILHTPGLVINEQVVSSARIPTVDEVRGWLQQAV